MPERLQRRGGFIRRKTFRNRAKIEAIANASNKQSEELGIQATPTFLLNGKRLDVTAWNQLEPLLQRAGAR
jgi:protein-disulfide isomerase